MARRRNAVAYTYSRVENEDEMTSAIMTTILRHNDAGQIWFSVDKLVNMLLAAAGNAKTFES